MSLFPTPAARLGDGSGMPGADVARQRMATRRNLEDALALLPTPRAADGPNGGPNQRGSAGDVALPAAVQPERWGKYADAVARWEALTRPAPDPTETGPKGGERLSPRFVEWMMGVPAGWFTDVDLGDRPGRRRGRGWHRSAYLKLGGNGVVPQQAHRAVGDLLRDVAAELAA